MNAPDPKSWLASLQVPEPAVLTAADFAAAAAELRCEEACIRAVTEVEAGSGGGFLRSRRPKILFEAHVFSRLTNHRFDHTHTQISSLTWNKALYIGGEREYWRLEMAMALNSQAALKSASWGLFQLMGFHYGACGCDSIEGFVARHFDGERYHLQAFVDLIQSLRLDRWLREKNWAAFAEGYNGAGFRKNQYDVRIAKAYRRAAARAG